MYSWQNCFHRHVLDGFIGTALFQCSIVSLQGRSLGSDLVSPKVVVRPFFVDSLRHFASQSCGLIQRLQHLSWQVDILFKIFFWYTWKFIMPAMIPNWTGPSQDVSSTVLNGWDNVIVICSARCGAACSFQIISFQFNRSTKQLWHHHCALCKV